MLFQLQAEKFMTEIRNRQRAEIRKQIRNKIFDNIVQQSQLEQAVKRWAQFLDKPQSVVPWEIVSQFKYLECSSKALPRIIDQILDPQYLINVAFVSKCALLHNIDSPKFCKQAMFVREPKDGKQYKRLRQFINLKHPQQVYLECFLNFRKTMPEGQKIQAEAVVALQTYFINYWNKYVDDRQLTYWLCSSIIGTLYEYQHHAKKIMSLVCAMQSVLIQQDSSPQTFWFVSVTFKIDPNIALHLLLNPRFPQFIYSGFNRYCLKDTLRILQTVTDTESYFQKLDVNYLIILQKMYQLYMISSEYTVQRDLLYAFYNLTSNQAQQIQEFYHKIDYEQMFEKCQQANLFHFFDFCVSALFYHPQVEVVQKMLLGKRINIIKQMCNEINLGQSSWSLAKSLYEALEMVLEKKILVQVIGVKCEQIAKKLENLDWEKQKFSKIKKQQKEEIIKNYYGLIGECK